MLKDKKAAVWADFKSKNTTLWDVAMDIRADGQILCEAVKNNDEEYVEKYLCDMYYDIVNMAKDMGVTIEELLAKHGY